MVWGRVFEKLKTRGASGLDDELPLRIRLWSMAWTLFYQDSREQTVFRNDNICLLMFYLVIRS